MGEKHRGTCVHFGCRASTAIQQGSSFHDVYCGSWCDRRDAKRYTLGFLIIWVVLANVWGHNFHSLESLVWRDSQSAWMFWELGRYSAVSVILFPIKYSQISFEILLSSELFVPPIFTKWDRAVTLSICRWTDFGFFTLQNDSIANLAAFIFKYLCGVVLPPCSTDPLLSVLGSVPPNLPISLHPTGL